MKTFAEICKSEAERLLADIYAALKNRDRGELHRALIELLRRVDFFPDTAVARDIIVSAVKIAEYAEFSDYHAAEVAFSLLKKDAENALQTIRPWEHDVHGLSFEASLEKAKQILEGCEKWTGLFFVAWDIFRLVIAEAEKRQSLREFYDVLINLAALTLRIELRHPLMAQQFLEAIERGILKVLEVSENEG